MKVCVATGSRAEYGLMKWVMYELNSNPDFDLQVLVMGAHLLDDFGGSYKEIEKDGFRIDAKVHQRTTDLSPLGIAHAVGETVQGVGDALEGLNPDLVLFMGDRYEMLALCSACLVMGVPMGHVSGGEITEGAFDDQIRHAITKMSHLHFAANEEFGRRIKQMGEERWRVCVSGEPGLDAMHRLVLPSREEFKNDIGVDLSNPTAVVTYHPVTLELPRLSGQVDNLLSAMQSAHDQYGLQYIITYPNADPGHEIIISKMIDFVKGKNWCHIEKSLGRMRYMTALRDAVMMIGNSSSGLYESPIYNLPVVNIGTRQGGRARAKNVIDVGNEADDILSGIGQSFSYDRDQDIINPYGDGHSSAIIVKFIQETLGSRTREQLLKKYFVDISE